MKKICPYGDRQQALETAMHSSIHIQLPEECTQSALPVHSRESSIFFFLIDRKLNTHGNRPVKVKLRLSSTDISQAVRF